MGCRVPLPLPLVLAALLIARPAEAAGTGKYLFDPQGTVRAVRSLDVDGDGRPDLILLVQDAGTQADSVVVLRTPAEPAARQYYPAEAVARIPLTGALADAGALAVGRFGPSGAVRLRFLGPGGILERTPSGAALPADEARDRRLLRPTLFGRSPGLPLVFWDGVADLDGDALDELWFPLARDNAPMQILGGRPGADCVLTLEANNQGASSDIHLIERAAYVPNLFPADLDGDGRKELVALQDGSLVAWPTRGEEAAPGPRLEATFRLPLPFLEPAEALDAEAVRTPRIQLADVDGDGATDLLVTLITGRRSRLESMRTILFHYPGPFRDPATGSLVAPLARIDTESIVLHPTFTDLDGDGDLDYVGDSIRGTRFDLIARMLGKDPEITYVGFRFDGAKGTFEGAPYFSVGRVYPSSEALSNRFGRVGFFDGDFDGDGHRDLLDLGDLKGVQVQRATPRAGRSAGSAVAFDEAFVPRVPVKDGLAAGSLVADLNGDGRADAILWSPTSLYLLVSKGED